MFGNDMNATGFATMAQQFWQNLQQMTARPTASAMPGGWPGGWPGAGFSMPQGMGADPFALFRQAQAFAPTAQAMPDISAMFAPFAQWGAAQVQADPFAQLRAGFEQWMGQGAKLAQGMEFDAGKAAHDALNVPGVGPMREEQERWQAIVRTRLEFDEVSLRFSRHFQELMVKTQQRFAQMLSEASASGKKLESARATFDMWVDAGENVWAQLAMSEAFQRDMGDLTNAQMRLQKAMQAQIDRFAATCGLPSRIEVDATARKVAALEREVRSLREQVKAGDATKREAQMTARPEPSVAERAVVVPLPVVPRPQPEAARQRSVGSAKAKTSAAAKSTVAATRGSKASAKSKSAKSAPRREAEHTATVTLFPLVDAPRAFGRKPPVAASTKSDPRSKRKVAK